MDESSSTPETLAALEGTWEAVRAELSGVAMPEFVAKKISLVLTPGQYVVRFDGDITDRGSFTLDPTGTTPRLTLLGVHGPNAGRRIPCLYQRVGDRLRICYGLDGFLPGEFTTNKDTSRYLATYRLARPFTPG